jgi:hypothetical protein
MKLITLTYLNDESFILNIEANGGIKLVTRDTNITTIHFQNTTVVYVKETLRDLRNILLEYFVV